MATMSDTHTVLIAIVDEAQRSFLASQLDADEHTVYEANTALATVARLSEHAI
jgi:hypothetical protein